MTMVAAFRRSRRRMLLLGLAATASLSRALLEEEGSSLQHTEIDPNCDGPPCRVWEDGGNPRNSLFCGTEANVQDVFLMAQAAQEHANKPDANRRRKLQMKQQNGGNKQQQTRYEVPVYFHSIQKDATGPFLSSGDETELMAALNKAFADSEHFDFTFKGTDREENSKWYQCGAPPNGAIDQAKTFFHKKTSDKANELHVYFCNAERTGYSTFPPEALRNAYTDGVVLRYPSQAETRLEVYWSFVHQVGHWFGLLHTFQDSCKGTPSGKLGFGSQGSSWTFAGDGVDDTPAHASPSWDYSGWTTCFANLTNPLDTCRDAEAIDVGVDPVNNYMNYISEECARDKGEFTAGQRQRMLSQYVVFRLGPNQDYVNKCLIEVQKKKHGCECDRKKPVQSVSCANKVVNNNCALSETRSVKTQERNMVIEAFKKACRY